MEGYNVEEMEYYAASCGLSNLINTGHYDLVEAQILVCY